jgi:hypothetical protein
MVAIRDLHELFLRSYWKVVTLRSARIAEKLEGLIKRLVKSVLRFNGRYGCNSDMFYVPLFLTFIC